MHMGLLFLSPPFSDGGKKGTTTRPRFSHGLSILLGPRNELVQQRVQAGTKQCDGQPDPTRCNVHPIVGVFSFKVELGGYERGLA